MAGVHILSGKSDRYYIGATDNLARRLKKHQRGSSHTTRRLGKNLKVVATGEVSSMADARKLERSLKRKKNPRAVTDAATRSESASDIFLKKE